MRIIDWLGDDFETGCAALGQRIIGRYKPDLVVGISTGGAVLAEAVCRLTVALNRVQRCNVTARRPGTPHKNKFGLKWWLPYLPAWICNRLRIAEMFLLKRRLRKGLPQAARAVTISEGAIRAICQSSSIVVIDDAVDSGATLASVMNQIQAINPAAMLHSAVVTVTLDNSGYEPDISVHRGIIVRFPWSADAPRHP